ncbi:MAG: glycoside hydrolase family 57 protein [Syntrophaceae bacterium]
MQSVCLNFHVHLPRVLRHYSFFDIDHDHVYEDGERNQQILDKMCGECYLPANNIMLDLIGRHKGDFRLSFSITGILLDLFEQYSHDVLKSFQRLADTGCVEFISETYYHSLAFLFFPREFKEQVTIQRKKIKTFFGKTPTVFRPTALIYTNALAQIIEKMGYGVILIEEGEGGFGHRSPNHVYQPAGCRKLKALVRNQRLSDDIAVRFADPQWSEYPLSAAQYAHWIHSMNDSEDSINIFMDYEIFGKHRGEETGIMTFMEHFPGEILKNPNFCFRTPSETARDCNSGGELDAPDIISPADDGTDLMKAWFGNALQKDAVTTLYGMEAKVRRRKDEVCLHVWRMLQALDHFTNMRTEGLDHEDGQQHPNPYGSPYDAYINYMNIIDDFSRRISNIKRS